MTTFRRAQTEHERRWPNGGYRTIALLSLQPTELERRLGVPLAFGVEEGLGPWRGIGLILPSGRTIELVWHEHAPQSSPTELRASAGDDYEAAHEEALNMCRLSPEDIAWIPPAGGI